MKSDITIRRATADDAEALLAIYGLYVEQTAITFELVTPSVEEFRQRIVDISAKFPYIVAECDGRIVGYSYAHTFRERAAYNHCVEMTVYVDRHCRRSGVGRRLYEEIERLLWAQGKINLCASVTWTDEEGEYLTHDSVHFHERMGYTKVGHFHRCGHKFNQWFDMIWMEKILSS